MKLELVIVLVALAAVAYAQELDLQERENALEYLTDKRQLEEFNLIKRFLYSGKEQRREVKENYEEKCERKLISAAMKKPRWCPELNTWDAWNKVSMNDKVKG